MKAMGVNGDFGQLFACKSFSMATFSLYSL